MSWLRAEPSKARRAARQFELQCGRDRHTRRCKVRSWCQIFEDVIAPCLYREFNSLAGLTGKS